MLSVTNGTTASVILSVVCLALSATISCGNRMPQDCEQFRGFFGLPSSDRHAQLKALPLEKQFEIYRCGMFREPPHTEFADDIADGGEKNIPFLLERLRSEPSEVSQHDIIYIFDVMAYRGGSLRGRNDVITEIKQRVSSMKGERVKYRSEQMLKNIEKNIAR